MTLLQIVLVIGAAGAALLALLHWLRGADMAQHQISLQTLASVAPAGIWRTDAEGRVIYVNQDWLDTVGLREGEWEGHRWSRAIHPEDREATFRKLMHAHANQAEFRAEWRFIRPDGATVSVLSLGAPEFDRGGRLIAYVGINIDIKRTSQLEAGVDRASPRSAPRLAAHSPIPRGNAITPDRVVNG